MRMDEGGHQKHRLFGVAFLDELDRAVADPLRRVRLRGELAYLRNVVHIASLTVVVEDVLVGRIFDELRVIIIGLRHFFLGVALAEAHKAVSVPNVVHLADAAGLKARLCEHRIKALARVAGLGVVVRVARAVDVLPRKERKTRGNADGGGSDRAVKDSGTGRDRIDRRSLRVGVAINAESIGTALVGHDDKNMLGFHFGLRVNIFLHFNYIINLRGCQYFIVQNAECRVQSYGKFPRCARKFSIKQKTTVAGSFGQPFSKGCRARDSVSI